jgi:chromosome segregation ATPase
MDGTDKMQSETRLVERLGTADRNLHESRLEVMDLKVEVRTAQLQSAALREEARLSSNVRLKLKQQLSAEKKRSEVLEEQVTEWKNKFKQLGPGTKPPPFES